MTDRAIVRAGLRAAGAADEDEAIDQLLSVYLGKLEEELVASSGYRVLPGAAPAIIAGLRISFGSALVAVVPAEMLLGELGIGYLSWIEWNNLDVAGVLFAIVVVGLVGVVLDTAFSRLAARFTYSEA